MLIMEAADFTWHNGFSDTFSTSLSAPIHKFLTIL